ncbi:hypothetical protein [Nocardioides sp.]|uniref:hypothetical protein n=1 Tax=Nocardioides sp. TaxID=35761 RepID=UPI002CC3A8E6|nr:hypothetical protein [Nocardioides sp.]HXH77666.1 hypothetical protein [Nocardioides sp.]
MARHLPRKHHACAAHTHDVVERLEPLLPCIDEEDTPIQPAELANWIEVEAEDEPEIAGHGWRVELGDEVGLLIHPDRDDTADSLSEQVGVRSVVQLDREVLVVDAPSLCADGLRAAVMQAIAAANEEAHDPRSPDQSRPGVPLRRQLTQIDPAPAAHTSEPVTSVDDDYTPRLVTGDARCEGRRVQVWVNQDGILILPAQTVPHGPLDLSDNARFQRGTFNSAEAVRLAEHHAGRWVPFPCLGRLRLRRPGPVRRRWEATIVERGGASVSFRWRGTRAHAMMLWAYVVAKCGLEQVDGLP